jgi:excinuclease UvrABC nuclease subunit
MFDADGALLYVGVAKNLGTRWSRHAHDALWWPKVQHQTADWYPNEPAAYAAEREAIRTESPRYNIAGRAA